MPLIEIVDEDFAEEKDDVKESSSSKIEEAEEKIAEDEDKTRNVSMSHAASWAETERKIPDFKLIASEAHPGAAYALKRDYKLAAETKERGNAAFKAKKYNHAIELFSEAIARVPIGSEDYSYSLAVFYSNRAACNLQLRKYESVVEDCDTAIEKDPRYVKAIMRRSKAKERLDRIEDAMDDMKLAVEVAPTCMKAVKELRRLDAVVKQKHEKMKTEVMGKLKDLGNSILGNFGMSMDNFKAVQDPSTGSYSISYQQ